MRTFLRLLPGAFVAALILTAVAVSSISLPAATVWACPPCSSGCDEAVFEKAGACPVCGMALVDRARIPASPANARQRNLAILIFPGVQIIDYSAPWEVFGHAHVGNRPAFRIYTVAPKAGPITTAMGMSVNPRYTFDDAPRADVLLVPGGNVDAHMDDPKVKRWIQETARNAELVLSVCNGAFFLARAGLLDGLEATTFAGLIDELQQIAPKTRVVRDKRFVDNGKIITSAGLSSGIDGALHVIQRLYGKGYAQVAATALEYDWRPEGGYVRAMLADRYLTGAYQAIEQFAERTVLSHEGTRDRWETRWSIRTDLSARDALERFERAIPKAEGWARDAAAASASSGGAARTVRRYRDSKGQEWVASGTFEPAAEKGKLSVVARVARAGAEVSSAR